MIKIPKQVNSAIEILQKKGYTAYVVGGAVRDAFMGRQADDWDIATSALPGEMAEAFKNYRVIETGIKHGTVTVIIDKMPLEITTYRIENGYSDNRHPDSVSFTDRIEDDLKRRDFTVNAIALSADGKTADPFDGIGDIGRKTVKCVGNPDERFNEDALRILRALRFSSVLDFSIDSDTAASIRKNYGLLANVSVERIFAELSKLLCGTGVGRILREYSEVIFFIMPELRPMLDCGQNNMYHIYDVWEHTVVSVENVRAEAALRFAMLFHDSGKPESKTVDESGTGHFYGHAKLSRDIAENILMRMNTSNAFRKKVCTLVEYHDFCPQKISKKTYRKYIGIFGADTVYDLFEVRKADAAAHAPQFFEASTAENEAGLAVLKEIESEDRCFKIKDLRVNGKELEEIGIKPSADMGRILSELLDEVMDDKIENRKEALLARASELNDSAERSKNGNS